MLLWQIHIVVVVSAISRAPPIVNVISIPFHLLITEGAEGH